MTDKTELKRLAEAAPGGPWVSENDSPYFKHDGYTRHLLDADAGHDVEPEAYYAALKFIAAANPAAVLALISENEQLGLKADCLEFAKWSCQVNEAAIREAGHETIEDLAAERDQLRAEVAGLKTGYEAYERVNAELKAEVEGLRKDAERYRWLRQDDVEQCRISRTWSEEQMDAAIDAALGQGEQS